MTTSKWHEFLPLAAIATTPTGAKKLQLICNDNITLWIPESLPVKYAKVYTSPLKDHLAHLWQTHRALIFCLATGAVVRLIAPLLQHKSTDPAIIVIDEAGKFVISLSGGHQGGADKLAKLIALQLNATAVVTGSSNALGLKPVDMLGTAFGWNRGDGDWNYVSAVIARGEKVQVIQKAGSSLWKSYLPKDFFEFEELKTAKAKIWITPKAKDSSSNHPEIYWHPRVLWVGIGCERGTPCQLIEAAIRKMFQENQLAQSAIAGIATIDLKADEVGLIEFCRANNLPLKTFAVDVLRNVSVPNPSSIVEKEVGTPSVAEAAAILAASCIQLLIPKQIFHSPTSTQKGAVTVAVAQAEKEYIGRSGKLSLVGIGPGDLDQMTPAAKIAVSGADAVVGYSLYLDLITSILQPGQIIETSPITQEKQRAQRAIELAVWGLNVAIVSSGDCGIYGMAGLVMEELQNIGWDGKTPHVEIIPGITALQATASRVGTPLMHDFCAISLSDLLTPWEIIVKRLEAAAAADFVTALYNPRSQTRTQQLVIARDIFLKYRQLTTPVAVVKSAYREDEQITLTTLEKLLDVNVDMLTTVLIGNQSTRTHANWMITPRGYNI